MNDHRFVLVRRYRVLISAGRHQIHPITQQPEETDHMNNPKFRGARHGA